MVASGISPVVASDLDSGVRQIAVHAADTNTLKYVNFLNQVVDTGVTMAAGSSPAIATGLPDTVILFVRDTGFPAVYDTATRTVRGYPPEAVAPNAGLAIQVIVNSNCGYEFTFVGADDHALWRGFSCADTGSTHIPGRGRYRPEHGGAEQHLPQRLPGPGPGRQPGHRHHLAVLRRRESDRHRGADRGGHHAVHFEHDRESVHCDLVQRVTLFNRF